MTVFARGFVRTKRFGNPKHVRYGGNSLPSELLALEPRIMLDGAVALAAIDQAEAAENQQQDAEPTAEGPAQASAGASENGSDNSGSSDAEPGGEAGRTIVIVDAAVADPASLLEGIDPAAEIYWLNGETDGVHQITSILSDMGNVTGLHILSHGTIGSITLGTAALDTANIESYAADFVTWDAALAEGADILLYGCNVAEDSSGLGFIELFSELAGADVAASTDVTGGHIVGGDWTLEAATGAIEAVVPFESTALSSFAHTLALAETGANDFRISDAGGSGNADIDASEAAIAYNSTDNEYLVVWQADDPDNGTGIVDDEIEIFGRRIDAATGARIGADFRISDAGGNGNGGIDAVRPDVAYNSVNNEYLVVWQADDTDFGLVDGESEIFGQRINAATGAQIGADFRISNAGGTGNDAIDALDPAVAYNSTDNEFLVVWHADDTDTAGIVDNENEIFGQRIDGATGAAVGANDFRISTTGGTGDNSRDAILADVAYNSTNNEFLVVWQSDASEAGLADNEFEIFGQRINAATGAEIGADFRISDAGGTGDNTYRALRADVAYNATDNEFLVVWEADDQDAGLADNEFEVFGQRIDASNGNAVGANDFRISNAGGTGNANADAQFAHVVYNSTTGEYLVTWQADDVDVAGVVDGELEIYGQNIDAATGQPTGANDFRISDAGGTGATSSLAGEPAAAYNSTDGEVLVVWSGPDLDSAGIVAGEGEVFGQRLGALAPPDLVAGSDTGTSDTDNVTSDTTPTFTGTAEPNATLGLFAALNGQPAVLLGQTNADGTGNWSFTAPTPLADGSYTVTVATIDGAGNAGPASPGLSVVIDTTPPVLSGFDGGGTFTENGLSVEIDPDVSVADAALDSLNNGNGDYAGARFTIGRAGGADAEDFFQFALRRDVSAAGGDLTQVSSGLKFGTIGTVGGLVIATFTSSETPATRALVNTTLQNIFYGNRSDTPPAQVTLELSFTDSVGLAATGTTQAVMNINAVNDPPTAANLPASLSFTEEVPGNFDLSAVGFADPDSPAISVTISVDAGGVFTMANPGGRLDIVGNGTSSVTLTGSIAAIEAYLDSPTNMRYTPPNLSGDTILPAVVTADDGTGPVALGTIDLSVTAVNEAPVLTDLTMDVGFVEDGPPTLIDSDVTVVDPEDDWDGGTLTISGLTPNDVVAVRSQGDGAGETRVDGTTIFVGGVEVASFAGGSGGIALTITFNAAANNAAVESVIQNLLYSNTSDTPTPTRTLSLVLTDAAGAEATGSPLSLVRMTGADNPLDGADVGSLARPVFVDLDGDTDLDAVVGRADGTLAYFENTGDAQNPVFVERVGAANPFDGIDVGSNAAPAFADLDGNGLVDLSVANGAGAIAFFRNTGTVTAPVFTPVVGADNPFNEINTQIGGNVTLTFVDIDGDGDLDGFVGNAAGTEIQFLRNVSNPRAIRFQTDADNPFNGLDAGSIPTPTFGDLDGDGDVDALVGNSDGTFRFFENVGSPTSPNLVPGDPNPLAGIDFGAAAAPVLVDIDGDGQLDAFVGLDDGTLAFFKGDTGFFITATVTPTDDPPELNLLPASVTVLEDTTTPLGLAGAIVSDVDSNQVSLTVSAGSGTISLIVNGNPSTFRAVTLTGTPAQINTVLATFQYTGAPNATGTDTLTFSVEDGTTTVTQVVDIDITPVNDAPAGSDTTITILEDIPHSFTEVDFGFSDASDTPANGFAAVVVTTLPTAGTLTLGGNAVTAGDVIAVADLANLVYTPPANANGAGAASFTFQVRDDGGTANGGVDTDPVPNTITFDITPVNDAPEGTDATVTILEDTPRVFSAADFGFSDPDDTPADALSGIVITTLPANGTLTLAGVAVAVGDIVSVADLGSLVYTPPANANGLNADSFSFQVRDDGGTANGGVDTDPTPNTLAIDITPVNDAPVNAGPDAQATDDDVALVFSPANGNTLTVSDIDAGVGPVTTTLTASLGTLTAAPGSGAAIAGNGTATLVLTGTVDQVNAALAGLAFTPSSVSGVVTALITMTTSDNGNTGLGGALTDTHVVEVTVTDGLVSTGTDGRGSQDGQGSASDGGPGIDGLFDGQNTIGSVGPSQTPTGQALEPFGGGPVADPLITAGTGDPGLTTGNPFDPSDLPGTIVLDPSSDSGFSDTDNVTGDNTPLLTGLGPANTTLSIRSDPGGVLGTVETDENGNWRFVSPTLADGPHELIAVPFDEEGRDGVPSLPLLATIDTAAPATPPAPALAGAVDQVRADDAPTFRGTAEPGTRVVLTSDRDGLVGEAVADENGNWEIVAAPLSENSHALTVAATDAAGNTSETSAALNIQVLPEDDTALLERRTGDIDLSVLLAGFGDGPSHGGAVDSLEKTVGFTRQVQTAGVPGSMPGHGPS